MFEPILDGEYTIRQSERYLSAESSGELGIVDKEQKNSVWTLLTEGQASNVTHRLFSKKYPKLELTWTEGQGEYGGLDIGGSVNPSLQFTGHGLTLMTGAAEEDEVWVLEPTSGEGDTWKFWQ